MSCGARGLTDAKPLGMLASIITALNLDVGRWIWWPSSLYRQRDVELEELDAETVEVSP